MDTNWIVTTGAVSCYPTLMVSLIWFVNKNVYCISTKQHGDMKSGVLRSKNASILQARCARMSKKSNYPHRQVNAIALHVFVTVTAKLQKFVMNEPDFSLLGQGSN